MAEINRKTLRAFIAALGGDAVVSARLGVSEAAISYCYDHRAFTASWYAGLCEMAREAGVEEPPLAWFGMKPLLDAAPAVAAE